jgi:hypothetical protein
LTIRFFFVCNAEQHKEGYGVAGTTPDSFDVIKEEEKGRRLE